MKGKKLIVSALVATMASAPVAVLNSTARVLAEDTITNESDELYTVIGPSVKVTTDYDKKARQNSEVTIPTAVASTGVVDMKIIDPTGKDVTAEAEGDKFTPKKVGVYTYVFTAYEKDGENNQTSIASTYELTLEVTGDSGSIEMPDNSYYVIPTEFLKGKTLTVPVPTAFLNDNEVEGFSSDDEVVEGDVTYSLKAFLVRSGEDDIVMTYNAPTGSSYDKLAYFSYTFANDDSAIGNYKLVYKLYSGDTVIAVSNAKTIKVRSSLTSNQLYASWATTPKKAASVEVEYSLVDINASALENSTDYVNAFTQITVTHQGTGEVMDVDYENMTFVPKYTGNYFVSYKAVIPSLNISSNVLSYTITNVEDDVAPQIHLTGSYLIDEDGNNYVLEADGTTKNYLADEEKNIDELLYVVGSEKHNVRSYYKMAETGENTGIYEVTVKIPAAYVIDNYSNSKNMTITRNLYLKSNTTESGRLKLIKSDDVEYGFNEVAEYTFSTAGTYGAGNYVVKYTATDETGRTTTSDYNITIKSYSDKTVVGVPTLTFSYDEEMIEKTDVVEFAVPTAVDSYDTNTLVKTYYGFEEPTLDGNVVVTGDEYTTTELNYTNIKDGKYSLDMAELIGNREYSYLYLTSVAYNSYDSSMTEGKNYIVKKIQILGANGDTTAPVYTEGFADAAAFNTALKNVNTDITGDINENGYMDAENKVAPFDQDDIVKIPAIKFQDADSVINFQVKVSYEINGEIVELNALEDGYSLTCEEVSGEYLHTLSGASFRVSYAKTYTMTIVATDSNGNTSFVSYAVRVNDTQPPIIIVPNKSKFSDDVEVGTKFTVPAPQISDNGEVDDAAVWSWSMVDPNGAKYSYTSNTRTFTPTILGTYVITYTAEDGSENANTSSEYRINVVATEKPVITLHGVIEDDTIGWDYVNDTQESRFIPKASAKDTNFNNSIIVDAPTVKNSKGNEVAVSESTDGSGWEFTPDVQGTYTITYSAQGKYLSNTVSYTMTIGDGEAPTVDWSNKSEDLVTTATVGDTWTFKFDMVSFDDNELTNIQTLIDDILADGVNSTSMEELSDYVTIKMKNPSNETVNYTIADNGLQYTFSESGSYTFTITAVDEAGNSTGTTYSYTITVSEEETEEAEKTSNDSVVGTVLIVLSVVILAGVVAYFAITTKQVDSKSKNKKQNKSKEDKKDNE